MKRREIILGVVVVALLLAVVVVYRVKTRDTQLPNVPFSSLASGVDETSGTKVDSDKKDNEIVSAVGNGGSAAQLTRYTATLWNWFETVTEIAGYAASKEDFEKDAGKLEKQLEYYHKLYDIYNSYDGINNIKTINDNAGIAPVKVDAEIINLMKLCKVMYEQTNGATNAAMGSVLHLWHEYRELGVADPDNAKLPPEDKLKSAAEHCNIDDVIIDEENSTVYLADADMSLDVGSIGKGYAVQRVTDYAREQGMHYMLISVGGNVCTIDVHPDGKLWKLGVQNPDTLSSTTYVAKVGLTDGLCIVSSGNYQRYYYVDDVRYCHIIDPKTLYPADYFEQVSVITADSGVADALSTALYTMTVEDGLKFVENAAGLEAMWVLKDGSLVKSSGFDEYINAAG